MPTVNGVYRQDFYRGNRFNNMYPTCSGNIDKCKNDCLLNRALEIKENIHEQRAITFFEIFVRLVFGRVFFRAFI